MLNEHTKKMMEYLEELRRRDREDILKTKGGSWQKESPIFDAMVRTEEENDRFAGDGSTGGMPRPQPYEWKIDVSLSGMADSVPFTPQPTPPPPKHAPPPRFSTPPANPQAEPDVEGAKVQSLAPESDNVSQPPQFFTPIQEQEKQIPEFVTPPGLADRQEKLERIREAKINRQNRQSMPFILGHNFVAGNQHPLHNQEPPTRDSDGGVEPEDIAHEMEFASDALDVTLISVVQVLEKITMSLMKMQHDMNVISEALDRTFGH